MDEPFNFADLIRRVREGDEDATTSLSRQVESHIRRCARIQMRVARHGDRVRSEVGTVDIFQSVLISLVFGLRKGRFVMETPEQLKRLLAAMVRLKLATIARKKGVTLRTGSSDLDRDDRAERPVDSGPGPEREAADRDLWEAVVKQFSDQELQLFVRRTHGEPWAQIAAETGVRPDALRKQLERAMGRVRANFAAEDLLGG